MAQDDQQLTATQAADQIRELIATEPQTAAQVVARHPELAVGLDEYLAAQPARAQGASTRAVLPPRSSDLTGRQPVFSAAVEESSSAFPHRPGDNWVW